MANLTNSDREIVGGITQISGATSNPTTALDDTITLSSTFLLAGSTSGLIDGQGGFDRLELNSSNLSNVDILGIEETQIVNNGTVTVDADQLGQLGALSFTDTFSTVGSGGADANLRLDFSASGATTVDASQIDPIGDELRVSITQTGQTAGQAVVADFGAVARGTVNSQLSYRGGAADETVTGTVGDDSIDVGTGTNVVSALDGDDTLRTSTGRSTLDGGAGSDSIVAVASSGQLLGGAGDDTITQSTGFFDPTASAYAATEIDGGADDDDISVSSVQGDGSTVTGGTGDDTLTIGATLRDATVDGGTGTDELRLAGGNYRGTDFEGVESTTFTNSGFVTIDADELDDLGALTFTDVFSAEGSGTNDANVQLNYDGLGDVTVGTGGVTEIGDELRVNFSQTGQVTGQQVEVDFSAIARGAVNSGLTYSGGVADETVTGTAGDDSLNASSGQNDLSGLGGDDTLAVGSGLSTLDGGAGSDSIVAVASSGQLLGGAGDDTITQSTGFFDPGASAYAATEIDGGADDDDISVSSVQGDGSTVTGGTGDDTIRLTSVSFRDGVVDGGDGTDALTLTSSNVTGTDFEGIESTTILNSGFVTIDADELDDLGALTFTDSFATVGSTTNDSNLTLDFAGGAATAVGTGGVTEIGDELRVRITQSGQSVGQEVTIDFSGIARGTENSLLSYIGNNADETITGTAGDDSLSASTGDNDLAGLGGDDTLIVGGGLSTLDGGSGDDSLRATSSSGQMLGGAGNDTISQSTGEFLSGAYVATEIDGGADDDDIIVGSVQGEGSTVLGGTGDDTIRMSNANMRDGTIDGGDGTDALTLQSSNLLGTDVEGIEGTTILNNGTVSVDADEVADLGALTVTDVFSAATNDANIALGVVEGANEADFSGLVLGDGENVRITTANTGPGAGSDLRVDLSGVARSGSQTLTFDNTRSFIDATVVASSGVDDLDGGTGTDDTLSYEASATGVTVDIQAETAAGGDAAGDAITRFENLVGSDAGDVLTGRDRAFTTDARGDNEITGLGGDDTITTGTGSDTVVATADNGDDTVTDFEDGADQVDLRQLSKDAAILAFLTATETAGGDTRLEFISGGSMVLEGLALGDFDIADVILEDGVYALDEAFTTDEDSVLTGDVLAANAPFGFTDIEIDQQVSLGRTNLEVVDFSIDGQTVAAGQTATLASGATLTVLADGSFTYDGTAATDDQALSELLGETLARTFAYTVRSTLTNETDEGEVDLTVTAVNDAPVIAGVVAAAMTEDGADATVDLLSQASDVDNGEVLAVVNGGVVPDGASVTGGSLTVDADDASFQELNAGETRDVVFTYDVQDAFGAITTGGEARVTVTGVNDDPTLAGALAAANEDGASVDVDLAPLGDDADGEDDGTTLSYAVVGQPGEGTAAIAGTVLTFDPGADFQDLNVGQTRDVTIQIQATDARGGTSSVADVVVTVTGTNDAPTLTGAVAAANEDGASIDLDLAPLGDDADAEDDGTTLSYAVVAQPSEGSASIDGTTLTFDPGNAFQDLSVNETRDVTIQIQATDARGVVSTVEDVVVTVMGTNDAPTLSGTVGAANEDGASIDIDLAPLGDDVDSEDDGASLAYAVVTDPDAGTAAIAGTTLTFDPGADFQDLNLGETRDVTVQIQATDAQGVASSVEDVVITVTGTNDAPTLSGTIGAANEDGASIDVDLAPLGDDADAEDDGATLSYAVVGQPSEGSAAVAGTTLTFDPGSDFQDLNLGETREVTVQVQATDARGAASSIEDVVITVTGTNDAPTLTGATAAAVEDGAAVDVALAGLGDDADGEDDGATLSYAVVAQPGEGTVAIVGTTLTFDPGSDFQDLAAGDTRDVTVQVQATDARGAVSSIEDVVVTVTGADDAPVFVALDGAFDVAENSTFVVDVDATDADAGETPVFSIAGGADGGLFTIDATTGELSFLSAPDFETPLDADGDNGYEVTVQAASGGETITQTLNVGVTDVNEAAAALVSVSLPDAEAPEGDTTNTPVRVVVSRTGDTSQPVTVTLAYGGTADANDLSGSQTATVTIPAGSSFVNVSGFTVRGDLDAEPDETVEVSIVSIDRADHDIQTGTATYTIENDDAANTPPVAVDDQTETAYETAVDVDVVANDRDDDRDALSLAGATLVSGAGTVAVVDGNVVFTPAEGFVGDAVIDYDVTDGTDSDTGTLTVTVEAPRGDIVADFDSGLEGWTFSGDARDFGWEATGGNPGGYLEARDQGAGGTWYFEASAAFLGDRSAYSGGTLSYDLQQSATSAQFDDADLELVSGGVVLALDLDSPGTGWTSYSVFLDTRSDWRVGTANGVVATQAQIDAVLGALDQLSIRGEYRTGQDTGGLDNVVMARPVGNVPPVAADDGGEGFGTDEDTAFTTASVLDNDDDADGGTLSVSALDTTGTQGTVTDNGDGTFDYDPDGAFEALRDGETATDSFAYTVSDGQGGTDTAEVTVTVTGVNDDPEAGDDTVTTDEDTAVAVALLSGDTDAETVVLSVSEVRDSAGTPIPFDTPTALPEGGVLTISSDGTGTFDPAGDFDALAEGAVAPTISLSYDVSDGDGGTDTGSVSIDVTGVNDAPEADDDAFTLSEDAPLVGADVLSDDGDPDGPAPTVAGFDTAGLAGVFTDNGDGTFDYDPNGQFESLAAGQTATETFTYTITDGALTDEGTVTLTIEGRNDAPVIVSSGAFSVPENGTAVGTVQASDPDDGAVLAFAIAGGADAALFGIDAATGALSFDAAPDFEAPGDAGGDNVYDVEVSVTDGLLTDVQSIQVTVTNLDESGGGVITDVAGQKDTLTGTDGADTFRILGGSPDRVFGLGGLDTYDLSAILDNGVRDVTRLEDYEIGEVIEGLAFEDVVKTGVRDGNLRVTLSPDRDVLVVNGITDLADLGFEEEEITDVAGEANALVGTNEIDRFVFLGGDGDTAQGLDGVDTFNVAALQANGSLDTLTILDYEAGELLEGLAQSEVTAVSDTGSGGLRLDLAQDGDSIVLAGVSDIRQVNFDDATITDTPGVGDSLKGTDGADVFRVFGGAVDRVQGGGGIDTFQLAALQLNGTRDVVRIRDYEVGELLEGLSSSEVQRAGTRDNELRLLLDDDRDLVILEGVTDLSAVTFDDPGTV